MTAFRWMGPLAIAVSLPGSGVAVAQDDATVAGGLIAHERFEAEQARRAEIQADREGTISRLMGMWAPAEGAYQLEVALQTASTEELLQVSRARSFEEVERTLLGEAAGAPFGEAEPNALGDPGQDYVYTPVTPCRILDTRNAGGAIGAGLARQFYVYGTRDMILAQGGNAAGCPAPAGRGEPRAVHLSLAVVPVGAQGNLRVYPANMTTPLASAINFQLGITIANALTVKTYYSLAAREIEVYAAAAAAHVIADVMGYYYDVAAVTSAEGYFFPGVPVDTDTATWISGTDPVAVAAGESVFVSVSAYVRPDACAGTCDRFAGIMNACYRVGTGTPTLGDGRFFEFESTFDRLAADVGMQDIFTFAGAGTYQFGLCARRSGMVSSFSDFLVGDSKTVVLRLNR